MSWAALAQQQDGVITRAQLRDGGLSDDAVDRLVRIGAVVRHARRIYLVRGAPLTYRAQLWIAVRATGGVLAFGTAAHVWGMAEVQPARIEVAIDPSRHVTAPHAVRVRRVFIPRAATQLRDGLPVTSRTWTVLDHASQLPPQDGHRLADRALQRGWLRIADIERRLVEYPGRSGNQALRRIARHCGDGAAAESERKLHRLLRSAGITGWVANYPLWAHGELVGVVDVAVRAARLAVEVDGWAFHSDVDRFQSDRLKQNALTALGWTVLRFTWADLTQRPGYVIASIQRQLPDRGANSALTADYSPRSLAR